MKNNITIVFAYINGSNSMSTGYAKRSVRRALDQLNIHYTVKSSLPTLTVQMSMRNYCVFELLWNPQGHGYMRYHTV